MEPSLKFIPVILHLLVDFLIPTNRCGVMFVGLVMSSRPPPRYLHQRISGKNRAKLYSGGQSSNTHHVTSDTKGYDNTNDIPERLQN